MTFAIGSMLVLQSVGLHFEIHEHWD